MKKIILVFISIFLLNSCGTETINKNTGNIKNTGKKIEKKENNFKEIYSLIKKIEDEKLTNKQINDFKQVVNSFHLNYTVDKAITSKKIDLCYNLDKKIINSCLILYATYYKNDLLCKKIDNESIKKDCFNSILKNKADDTGNLKLCDKMTFPDSLSSDFKKMQVEICKSEILINNAQKKGDKALCNKVKLDDYKNICLDLLKNKNFKK